MPCSENSLRLGGEGGDDQRGTLGRVEVCVGGAYGTVSSVGFDDRQAAAVCTNLGFRDEGKHYWIYHIQSKYIEML